MGVVLASDTLSDHAEKTMNRPLLSLASLVLATTAFAAPVTYKVDSRHTFPSFQADHGGGMSYWRGKFNTTSGSIVLDKAAGTGSVDILIDATSIDFGLDDMNKHAKSADMFDVEKFPTATYKGKLVKFKDGAPTEVDGELTLHGVTKPLKLTIHSFKCKPNREQKDNCGADASAKFNREDFGVSFGKSFGFLMDVTLQIQVEATAQ
jgi:polyisoprenoid-binding protein YceI